MHSASRSPHHDFSRREPRASGRPRVTRPHLSQLKRHVSTNRLHPPTTSYSSPSPSAISRTQLFPPARFSLSKSLQNVSPTNTSSNSFTSTSHSTSLPSPTIHISHRAFSRLRNSAKAFTMELAPDTSLSQHMSSTSISKSSKYERNLAKKKRSMADGGASPYFKDENASNHGKSRKISSRDSKTGGGNSLFPSHGNGDSFVVPAGKPNPEWSLQRPVRQAHHERSRLGVKAIGSSSSSKMISGKSSGDSSKSKSKGGKSSAKSVKRSSNRDNDDNGESDDGDDIIDGDRKNKSQDNAFEQGFVVASGRAGRQAQLEELTKDLHMVGRSLELLEYQLSQPIQDVIVSNYSTIQKMALKSVDTTGHKKNSKMAGLPPIQVVENIAGGFRGEQSKIESNHNKSAKMLGNSSPGAVSSPLWSLPQVDGVSPAMHQLFSSEPQIDTKNLSNELQQIVGQGQRQLLEATVQQHNLLESHAQTSSLLPSHSTTAQQQQHATSSPSELSLSTQSSTPLTPAQQHKAAIAAASSLAPNLAKNLPVSDAFLPPMMSLAPPSELVQEEHGSIAAESVLTVSLPEKVLKKQLEQQYTQLYNAQKERYLEKYGKSRGLQLFKKDFPNSTLSKRHVLPKEGEIHAKFMGMLTNQQSLIKNLIKVIGYGHVQQTELRSDVISSILENSVDDHQSLLLVLKENNVIIPEMTSLDNITETTPQGKVVRGKDALAVLASKMGRSMAQERVILPYSSPDGHSDAHLPVLLRQAVTQLQNVFNSMKMTITPSATAYTSMISLYGQLGLPARAAQLFDELIHESDTVPDSTTYNVMLNILVNDNKIDLASQLFERMRNTAIQHAGHGVFPALPPKHAEARKIAKLRSQIARKARQMGIEDVDFSGIVELVKDTPSYKNTYLNATNSDFNKDKFSPSRQLIARPDVITYTTMIKAYGKQKQKSSALKLFHQMMLDKVTPNELTWTTIIDTVCDSNDFLTGLRLFHEMKRSGIKPTRAVFSSMATSSARNGELMLTTALLEEMSQQQQQNLQEFALLQQERKALGLSVADLNQSYSKTMLIDANFLANIMRSSAESGNAPYALKLHAQLLQGQLTGLHSLAGSNQHGNNATNNNNISLPNAITYNALLEVLADPASWGRSSLPPAALRIGLAVYQEALIRKVFPHPYSEVQSTGVVDLRLYTRAACVFPIHLVLNSLLGDIPVYSIDGSNLEATSSKNHNALSGDVMAFSNSHNLDLAVQQITGRSASRQVVGQSPYSVVLAPGQELASPKRQNSSSTTPFSDSDTDWINRVIASDDESQQRRALSTTNSNNNNAGIALTNPYVKFPSISIPPKGIVFIASKELKPAWTAGSRLQTKLSQVAADNNPQHFAPIVYVENVLRCTKPWLHFTRVNQNAAAATNAASKRSNTTNDSSGSGSGTPRVNPNAVVVSANALRVWKDEQLVNKNVQTVIAPVSSSPGGGDHKM